jgi:hypothetical protein
MNLSQLKKGDRFYERSLIFCRQHVAISAPYMVAHLRVINTINGPVSENTLVIETAVKPTGFSRGI